MVIPFYNISIYKEWKLNKILKFNRDDDNIFEYEQI